MGEGGSEEGVLGVTEGKEIESDLGIREELARGRDVRGGGRNRWKNGGRGEVVEKKAEKRERARR